MSLERERHCVALEDLRAYAADEVIDGGSRIQQHLEECSRCAEELDQLVWDVENADLVDENEPPVAIPESVRALAAAHQGRLQELTQDRARPPQTMFAQIWSTRAFGIGQNMPPQVECPRIVVVLVDEAESYDPQYPDAIVAPICRPSEEALLGGVEVDADEGPLGYSFVIEVWNRQGILTGSLDRYLGDLGDSARSRLADALSVADQTPQLEEIPSREIVNFREAEIASTDYIRAPVRQLMAQWAEEAALRASRIQLVPRTTNFSELRVAASLQTEAGWPVTLEAELEGIPLPAQLRFTWLGFDLVVEHLGPAAVGPIVVALGPTDREVVLSPGAKGRLGSLAALALSSESRTDEIVAALLRGLTVAKAG